MPDTHTPTAIPLPSVFDLARAHHALRVVGNQIAHQEDEDNPTPESAAGKEGDEAANLIEDLIMLRPIYTLEDATALAIHASAAATNCSLAVTEGNALSFSRAFSRIAVILSAATGLNLDHLADPYISKDIRDRALSADDTLADELDAGLWAACDKAKEAERALQKLEAAQPEGDNPEWEDAYSAATVAWQEVVERVNECPAPVTQAGWRAKARVAHNALTRLAPEVGGEDTRELRVALDLLGDIGLAEPPDVPPMVSDKHPDADLIRACQEHPIRMAAYNEDNSEFADENDNPLWLSYSETRDFITDAEPKTLDGILAKARAAKAEAIGIDDEECRDALPDKWAWDLVGDLLRLRPAPVLVLDKAG